MRGSRRTRLTLVLLLLTAFTLTALDYNSAQSGPLASLRRGIDTVFGPVQKALGSAASSVGDALGGLPRLGKYQSENKKLKQENDRLKGQLASQEGLQCRYDQFLALQGLVAYTKYQVLPGNVVGFEPSSDFEWVAVINLGSADGVKKDQTVVTGAGLVGRTTDVLAHTSKVLLLADEDFRVGGTLANLGLTGLADGNGARSMSFSLPGGASGIVVKKGTELLTTGSGTYAPGIPIGRVLTVTPDITQTSRTATIEPFVDVSSLDVIGVIAQPETRAPVKPLVPYAPGASPTSSACAPAVPQGAATSPPPVSPRATVPAGTTATPSATPTP